MKTRTISNSTIKRIRTNKTMTMRELSERVGLTTAMVRSIFYNNTYIDPDYTPNYRRGGSDNRVKLTREKIIRIFKAQFKGVTQSSVAAKEGVSQPYVSMIQRGAYYSEITSKLA